jgi:hypothetical protein
MNTLLIYFSKYGNTQKVAEYIGTELRMNGFLKRFTAAKKLAQKQRKMGSKRLVSPEAFHVMEREGPLYDGELERAKTWAELILQKAGNPI